MISNIGRFVFLSIENSSETHVRLLTRETPLENGGVQIEREVIVNKPLDNDHICELIDKLVKLDK